MMAGAYDEQGRRKYLTASESERFLAAADARPDQERLLCRFLYFTGTRVTEAISLIPEEIDLEAKEAIIRTLKKRGKNERRRIPLPDALLSKLEARLSEDQKIFALSRSQAWRITKATMTKAGISGIHANCKALRHTFAVRAVMSGVPLTLIKNLMGHSRIETTSIYLDVRDEEQRELVSKTW